jgi:hypothetical protein
VDVPAGLNPERHRDLVGRTRGPWIRRVVIVLLTVLLVVALAGFFGQPESSSSVAGSGATMSVSMPKRLRGGLIYEARFTVTATKALEQPKLVLDRDWFDGMTLNSTVPSPVSEATRDGRVVLSYDTLDAGDTLRVWTQWQVNPTSKLGTRTLTAELDDRSTPIATLERDLTVFP